MEAFMYRCNPQTARIVKEIKAGKIGDVRLIKASFSFHAGINLEGCLFNPALGGGGIYDVGCYPVSMVRLIAGASLGKDFADPIELKGMAHIGEESKVDEWASTGPYVSRDGAEWLAEQNIRGVAIDTVSIGGVCEPQNSLAHEALLSANVWIMEDLFFPEQLFSLPQPLEFWGLPVNLRGCSGAFCRPVIVVG